MHEFVCCRGSSATVQLLSNDLVHHLMITACCTPTACMQVLGVAAGSHHTLLATEQGELLAFGRGASGCLGLGDADDQDAPVVVDGVIV